MVQEDELTFQNIIPETNPSDIALHVTPRPARVPRGGGETVIVRGGPVVVHHPVY